MDNQKCILNVPPAVRVRRNVVHTLRKREWANGLEINLNWRYWGISVSWGDSLSWDGNGNSTPIWFYGLHVGPLFLIYGWAK